MKYMAIVLAIILLWAGCSQPPDIVEHGKKMYQDGFEIGVILAIVAIDRLGNQNASPNQILTKAKELHNEILKQKEIRSLPYML